MRKRRTFVVGGQRSESGDFATVARVLRDYFEDDGGLDIVPSDVAAGIIRECVLGHV